MKTLKEETEFSASGVSLYVKITPSCGNVLKKRERERRWFYIENVFWHEIESNSENL